MVESLINKIGKVEFKVKKNLVTGEITTNIPSVGSLKKGL